MQREALAERPSLAAMLDEEALAEARRAIGQALGDGDVDHFLLELVALSRFPIAHRDTFVAALGFDARDPDENPRFTGVLEADDGTRTHDLLHGNY
jgi:hypothetical protein